MGHYGIIFSTFSIGMCSHMCGIGAHAFSDLLVVNVSLVNNSKCTCLMCECRIKKKKVKVAHTRLPSVAFRSWSQILAVSLEVTWVINPAVGCHYFPPGLQLPLQPLRGLLPIFAAWWTEAQWVWAVCLRLLPDSVAAAIWTQALLCLSPAC